MGLSVTKYVEKVNAKMIFNYPLKSCKNYFPTFFKMDWKHNMILNFTQMFKLNVVVDIFFSTSILFEDLHIVLVVVVAVVSQTGMISKICLTRSFDFKT